MQSETVTRYLETFEHLRRTKRWTDDTSILRFVAITLAAAGLPDPRASLDSAAAVLKERAGWTSPLRSHLRYVAAAMILRRGLDPAGVHARVIETRKRFKDVKIPRGGTGPLFAALLMVLHEEGGSVPKATVARLSQIYARMKDDHFWLTDKNDLPAAVVHALRSEPVDQLAEQVESAYRRLHGSGFRRGNSLQLASQLLPLDPRGVSNAIQRFSRIAETLKAEKERVSTSRYGEIAVLALAADPPAKLVTRLLRIRDTLRAAKPRPSKDLAFSLATGLTLSSDMHTVRSLKTIQSVQAILDAQQAVMVASIAAATAAASSAAAAG